MEDTGSPGTRELQAAVKGHIGAGNQTVVLYVRAVKCRLSPALQVLYASRSSSSLNITIKIIKHYSYNTKGLLKVKISINLEK